MADHNDPTLWQQMFNEQGQLTLFFGAMGGVVRSATLKTSWKEAMRVVTVGGCVAFGVGALAPTLLEAMDVLPNDVPTEVQGAIGYICATAFLIGLLGVTIVEKVIGSPKSLEKE